MRSNGGRWNGSVDQVWRRGLVEEEEVVVGGVLLLVVLAVVVVMDMALALPVLVRGMLIDDARTT